MESGTCGLGGTVHVSNVASSSTCQGSVSDWDSQLCRGLSQLWLSLAGHCISSSHAVNGSLHRRGRIHYTSTPSSAGCRAGFKGGGESRGPGPQASHQQGASDQTLHILFSFVICVCLAFLIFRLLQSLT